MKQRSTCLIAQGKGYSRPGKLDSWRYGKGGVTKTEWCLDFVCGQWRAIEDCWKGMTFAFIFHISLLENKIENK